MNLIFLRHGEAENNVKKILSDKEIYWSTLTENGKNSIKKTVEELNDKIGKVYVSPFPRTIETAHYVYQKYPQLDFIIDNRLCEIYYGKYSGKENNKELDSIREKQKNNDYFIRFGEYGENKYDIEYRLTNFLFDLYNNLEDSTILIISHGSIISYIKRILNLKSPHIKTAQLEKFNNIDFKYLFNHINKLKNIKSDF